MTCSLGIKLQRLYIVILTKEVVSISGTRQNYLVGAEFSEPAITLLELCQVLIMKLGVDQVVNPMVTKQLFVHGCFLSPSSDLS